MQQKISYWVDHDDIIRKVDDYWDLTLENADTPRVKSEDIVGQSLFEFICDDVTRMYVRTLLQSVRLIPRPLCRPYRCDSPTEKRYMQMTLTLEENGLACVSHELIKTEPLQKPANFQTLLPKLEKVQTRYNVRCSICNKIRLINNPHWQEVDTLLQSDMVNQTLKVMYGICPTCMESKNKKNKKMEQQNND